MFSGRFSPPTEIRAKQFGIEHVFQDCHDKLPELEKFLRRQALLHQEVAYIGDGLADYHAARNADFSFAIKGSKLAELLKRDGIPHKEISDFQEVVEIIDAALAA